MGFTAIAIVAGLVLGRLTGGRLRHAGEHRFRAWQLLAAGATLQLLSNLLDGGGPALGLLLASYAALLAFTTANLRIVGMWLVLLGLGLNALVITVNGGMPVKRAAVVAAGLAAKDEVLIIDSTKRHLATPDTRLLALGDIVPVRPLGQVLSFGDLMMSVGVADVVVHLLRPRRPRLAP